MSRGALTNGCHVDGHPRCSRDNERGDAYVLMYEVAERKQKISPQQISDLRKQISLAPATQFYTYLNVVNINQIRGKYFLIIVRGNNCKNAFVFARQQDCLFTFTGQFLLLKKSTQLHIVIINVFYLSVNAEVMKSNVIQYTLSIYSGLKHYIARTMIRYSNQ